MNLGPNTTYFLTEMGEFFRILRKAVLTIFLLIFGGIISCGFISVKLEEWKADEVCQRNFGEGFRSVTRGGDVYGAFCIGPNGRSGFARP